MGMAKTIALIKALGGGNGGSNGGSGGGFLIVNEVEGSLDKTWAEIHSSEIPIAIHLAIDGASGWEFPMQIIEVDGAYMVNCINSTYVANTESGYPAFVEGGGEGGDNLPK